MPKPKCETIYYTIVEGQGQEAWERFVDTIYAQYKIFDELKEADMDKHFQHEPFILITQPFENRFQNEVEQNARRIKIIASMMKVELTPQTIDRILNIVGNILKEKQ